MNTERRYPHSDTSLRPRKRIFRYAQESLTKKVHQVVLLGSDTKKRLEDLSERDVEALVNCLVQDLESFPCATSSESIAISKLPENLKTRTFSSHSNSCSIHKKLPAPLLDSLDKKLLHIAKEPPFPLYLTSSRYCDAFIAIEGVWSEEIAEFSKSTVPNCPLYQKNNCSGCRVRRVLSDGLLLDALLVADYLEDSGLRLWLVLAWMKLTQDIPDQVHGRGELRFDERIEEVNMLKKNLERLRVAESSTGGGSAVAEAAKSCPDTGLQLVSDAKIEVTEELLKAARDERQGIQAMEILLAKDPKITIPQAVLTTAAGNIWQGKEMIELLIGRGYGIVITETVLVVAARNTSDGKEIMELLLARDPDIEITEAIMVAAAGNCSEGNEIIELLLAMRANIQITEAVLVAAAANWGHGKEIIEVLLSRDAKIKITEEVLLAAAGNNRYSKEVMEVLLSRDSSMKVTPAVVDAVLKNEFCGKKIMKLLPASRILKNPRDAPLTLPNPSNQLAEDSLAEPEKLGDNSAGPV